MTYEAAMAIRLRHINNQPVDREELAMANRTIAHQRSMTRAFGNERELPPLTRPAALPVVRKKLPRGCISVDEWLDTLPASESYKPEQVKRTAPR